MTTPPAALRVAASDAGGGAAPPAATPRARRPPDPRNRSGPRALHGSYRRYYARRLRGLPRDDRVPLIRRACALHVRRMSPLHAPRPHLRVLDVGCNDGSLTMRVAAMPRAAAVVGLDIDPGLVAAARAALRESVAAAATEGGGGGVPLSCRVVQGPVPPAGAGDAAGGMAQPPAQARASARGARGGSTHVERFKFPYNTTFRCEDFAAEQPGRTAREKEKYDVVLCLSVTKWVHLAGGDVALKRLFRRIADCLKPGGLLILEPQPAKSYKSAIRKGLASKAAQGKRKLQPHMFKDYLIKEGGFFKMRMLRELRERGHAFNRPIMAFYKLRNGETDTHSAVTDDANVDDPVGQRATDPELVHAEPAGDVELASDSESVGDAGSLSNAEHPDREDSEQESTMVDDAVVAELKVEQVRERCAISREEGRENSVHSLAKVDEQAKGDDVADGAASIPPAPENRKRALDQAEMGANGKMKRVRLDNQDGNNSQKGPADEGTSQNGDQV